jgi:hypothetical protein
MEFGDAIIHTGGNNDYTILQSRLKTNYFDLLPQDLLECLLLYLDIPSIAVLCQTSLPSYGNISDLASRDQSWLRITNERFNLFSAGRIAKNNVSRPKLYGGSSWKDAYRVMARTCRMPKMNVNFKRKTIFARGCGYMKLKKSGGHSNEGSRCPASSKQGHYRHQFMACWVLINHTEDCNLRSAPMNSLSSCTNAYEGVDEAGTESPYIELQVAFQNTKSGFCHVDIDICKATVQMLAANGDFITQRVIYDGPLSPKIVYRSSLPKNKQSCEYLDGKDDQILSLKPFEFVIVSVNVPLVYYRQQREVLQFETDFLSRALSIAVPASCKIVESGNDQKCNSGEMNTDSEVANKYSTVGIVTFANEHEIWESYMKLPGNCVVLTDICKNPNF